MEELFKLNLMQQNDQLTIKCIHTFKQIYEQLGESNCQQVFDHHQVSNQILYFQNHNENTFKSVFDWLFYNFFLVGFTSNYNYLIEIYYYLLQKNMKDIFVMSISSMIELLLLYNLKENDKCIHFLLSFGEEKYFQNYYFKIESIERIMIFITSSCDFELFKIICDFLKFNKQIESLCFIQKNLFTWITLSYKKKPSIYFFNHQSEILYNNNVNRKRNNVMLFILQLLKCLKIHPKLSNQYFIENFKDICLENEFELAFLLIQKIPTINKNSELKQFALKCAKTANNDNFITKFLELSV